MKITENPFLFINQEDFNHPDILNSKLSEGCKKGFYFVEVPNDCKELIIKSVEFGYAFYNDPKYTSLKIDSVNGYASRKQYQIESLILEEKYWSQYLPEEVAQLAKKMCEIGLNLLKITLSHLNIPEEKWTEATGGAIENPSKASNFHSFHHYREYKNRPGLGTHKDIGLITVLYPTKKGLDVFIKANPYPVEPMVNYFLINYGSALEDYVGRPDDLKAVWHRVNQVSESRLTFAGFINHNQEEPVYKTIENRQIKAAETFNEYMMNKFQAYDIPPEIQEQDALAQMESIHS